MKKWSDSEEIWLIRNYNKLGKKECAKKLKRTIASVQTKMFKMGGKMTSEQLRKKIIELTGETPEDLFGEDGWEEYAEEYLKEENEFAIANKFGGIG